MVFEGVDGAGKSEQTERLAAWLRARGRSVVETREPTDGAWGRRYRAWARGEIQADRDEVLRFFIEDRREHVARVIRPAQERGDSVVCDRYVDSTLAYQAAQGVDRDLLRARIDAESFPTPDLVIWLRLPVAAALKRLGGSATERFERADFLARVDAEYERLGLEPLDASPPPDIVGAAVRQRLRRLWRERRLSRQGQAESQPE